MVENKQAETNMEATKWNWRQSPDLMARLRKAQNSIKAPIDIMTFVAFTNSEAELKAHVEYYEGKAS